MAKLNPDLQAKTDAAETQDFSPVPAGVYKLRLREVDTSRPPGKAGPYWSWEFEVVEPKEHENRRLWQNTSLAENALWKLKETFEAFGVGTDTDTDLLCGKTVKGVVSTRTIQAGSRMGELGNNIDRLMPADEQTLAAVGASSPKQDADDIF